MLKLADKDIKTDFITIFLKFKKLCRVMEYPCIYISISISNLARVVEITL